jgi:hypothetical protein
MEITLDRASKFYEPGEKVTGTIVFKDFNFTDLTELNFIAESYQDTVSEIRGSMGRPPLDEKERTYFMKKKVDHKADPGNPKNRLFEFVLEATEEAEKLIDAYVGVDFSVVVSFYFIPHLLFSTKLQPQEILKLVVLKRRRSMAFMQRSPAAASNLSTAENMCLRSL